MAILYVAQGFLFCSFHFLLSSVVVVHGVNSVSIALEIKLLLNPGFSKYRFSFLLTNRTLHPINSQESTSGKGGH